MNKMIGKTPVRRADPFDNPGSWEVSLFEDRQNCLRVTIQFALFIIRQVCLIMSVRLYCPVRLF